MLAAALAVLAVYPEECMKNGKVSPSAIAREIELSRQVLFSDGRLPLSERVMQELISSSIKKIQK